MEKISDENLHDLTTWLTENKKTIPPHIYNLISKMVGMMTKVMPIIDRSKDVLHLLRQSMGIIPKTEKGSSTKRQRGFF